ncbi:MAG TPA: DUF3313 family protein [Steroidobacteraceae bacterium]|jgi:hypothetical protein|nr:DUF3313 family protein [Steroidobacteraceae bacterium]
MRRHAWKFAPALALLAIGAFAQVATEVPGDGLVRIPSSREAAVYRSPDVSFVQYKRLMFDRVAVSFKAGWRRDHPKLSEAEVERVRSRAASGFQEELAHELVDRGHYVIAEAPAPDVLRVKPLIVDLDQTAPTAGMDPSLRSYARTATKMTLIVELYDAASGVLVGRIRDLEPAREYPEPRRLDQVFIETEARHAFANASRLVHEALSVAMTERPR